MKPSILILERDPWTRACIDAELGGGVEVHCAACAEEAEVLLATRSIDAALIDFLDVLPQIVFTLEERRIPWVLLASPDATERGRLLGAVARVEKPVEPERLRGIVDRLLVPARLTVRELVPSF